MQDGFPTDRVLTRRGNLAFLYDAATRLLKLNTSDAYPVVLGGGDNRTFTFYFPYALPNVAVGDAVAVRCPDPGAQHATGDSRAPPPCMRACTEGVDKVGSRRSVQASISTA